MTQREDLIEIKTDLSGECAMQARRRATSILEYVNYGTIVSTTVLGVVMIITVVKSEFELGLLLIVGLIVYWLVICWIALIGSIFAVGGRLNPGVGPTVLLVFPLLALFIALIGPLFLPVWIVGNIVGWLRGSRSATKIP